MAVNAVNGKVEAVIIDWLIFHSEITTTVRLACKHYRMGRLVKDIL